MVAIEQQKVRAPFCGFLVSLVVTDGDRVRTGQIVGRVLSLESQAALIGAEKMLQSAQTAAQRRDAERALVLARRSLVTAALRVPETGVVVAHTSDEGDLVAQGQDILTIAATDSIVFEAEVVQSELSAVRPGQPALVTLTARDAQLPARVHALLPAASTRDLTAPVRLDFHPAHPGLALGLFGTARIRIGCHPDAEVVPEAAILRDDLTGTSRLAVAAAGTAHWLTVRTGLVGAGQVELLSPLLPDGARVSVSGQVGLPEGSRLAIRP